MHSSSSSDEVPQKLTIVLAPVQLTTYDATEHDFKEILDKIAKDLSVPVPLLFSEGLVKIYRGSEVPVRHKDADIDVSL